jgi:hypothetical protein
MIRPLWLACDDYKPGKTGAEHPDQHFARRAPAAAILSARLYVRQRPKITEYYLIESVGFGRMAILSPPYHLSAPLHPK